LTRHVVGPAAEVSPGSVRIIDLGPWGVGVFNCNGSFHALNNYCPHAGAPVCRGQVTGMPVAEIDGAVEWERDGEILRCPWHGWEFDIATGKTVTRPHRAVKKYRVAVEDGEIVVYD
jgi:nitrite reductase (NADH) small subunit